jgi:hypothetical protein
VYLDPEDDAVMIELGLDVLIELPVNLQLELTGE